MDTNTQATGTETAPPPAVVTTPSAPAVPAPTFPEGTKLREYETYYLVKPELADDAVDKLKERIRALVVREGGKVIKFITTGKKKIHFEIAKQNRAVYVYVHYVGPAKIVAELERNMRMIDDVIRFQTVKLAEETDANRPVEEDLKVAGDVDQPERPPREERERGGRDDFSDAAIPDLGNDDDSESA